MLRNCSYIIVIQIKLIAMYCGRILGIRVQSVPGKKIVYRLVDTSKLPRFDSSIIFKKIFNDLKSQPGYFITFPGKSLFHTFI